MLTASANDFGFAHVCERQVQALGRPGDVLVAVSTGGDGENTLCALNYASAHGMHTITLTRAKMAAAGEIVIRIPSESTAARAGGHIPMGHILWAMIERSLFPAAM